LLDHRVEEQLTTRRLRVVKYRGSSHGTNEYPFLIGDDGISLLPITSVGLNHTALTEQLSTGIERLDAMLGGQGYYRGSTILLSGTAGAGKSSLAAQFANAAAQRGERCLYVAMEESEQQILRNMRSIGINLEQWTTSGRLRFYTARPTLFGLEMHLVTIHKIVQEYAPDLVIVDPVTNLTSAGNELEVKAALLRLVDYLKTQKVTSLFTSLTNADDNIEQSEVGVSSLMDLWILLKMIETNGERNRGLYVLKARGLAHSNQIREFKLTSSGIQLLDVYMGSGGVLTGTARMAQEAHDRAVMLTRQLERERKQRDLERKRALLEANIRALQAEFAADEEEVKAMYDIVQQNEQVQSDASKLIGQQRGRDRSENGS
jgi:circadian clock protein KaiC